MSAGLALAALLVAARPAQAALTFCNESSYLLEAAVAEETAAGLRVAGWIRMDPGDCATAIDGTLGPGRYYAFARTRPAHGAGHQLTAGGRVLCVDAGDFELIGANACAGRGLRRAEFARIETGGAADWTATFEEDGSLDREGARVAGVQRLLTELGYKPGQIDGRPGGRTTRAIREFQKTSGLARDGAITTGLYRALETAAEARLRRIGFHFCNETQYLVWAAIGYRQAEEWRSNGWIRVAPDACAPAIADVLDEPVYYAYAEAVTDTGQTATRAGVPMIWGGDRTFCTKPTMFFIRGRTGCMERGYDRMSFKEIRVGEADAHVFRLR